MEYHKIVSVTGLPGLYEIISSKNDGALVRSLDDKTTRFVSSRTHNLSHLESIEVYTVSDNVNLVEVFQSIEKKGEKLPDEKDAKGVKSFFEKVFPELDFERVYHSDMKKMVRWYSILKAQGIDIKLSPEEHAEEEVVEEAPEATKATVNEEKKAKAKKPAEEASVKATEKQDTKAEKAVKTEKTAPKAEKTAKAAGEEKKEAPKKAAKKK